MQETTFVLVTPWFGEQMGYIENALPKALGACGVEAHVVTSQLQPHFSRPNYKDDYEPWNGPAIQPAGVFERDGFTLHRLRHLAFGGQIALRGLGAELKRLAPDVVQVLSPVSLTTLQVAIRLPTRRFKLYSGAHRASSTFPLGHEGSGMQPFRRATVFATRSLPGTLLSVPAHKCFAVTPDCANVAAKYYGVPQSKLVHSPLGVDTSIFFPPTEHVSKELRARARSEMGFGESSIVCIYSGYLTNDKGVHDLAAAVANLRMRGLQYESLFIGSGPEAESLRTYDGATVLPFVPWSDLGGLYRSADIAVWPRSYSTSQLDAAACGLPMIVSDDVQAPERYEGIGVRFQAGDVPGLEAALLAMQRADTRRELGDKGARRMSDDFGWLTIARQRLWHYMC